MEESYDYEPMNDLIETKQNLVQKISEFYRQIEDTKNKICLQKNELTQMQKERAQLLLESAKMDMTLFKVQLELNSRLECQQELNKFIKDSEDQVQEESLLNAFESEVSAIRNSMQSAMAFYTDDSLQMELMKSENAIREKRVEYTKVETDYNALLRKIEDQQREKQRLKEAELERQRQEDERLKRLEEERAKSEEARARDNFREQKQVSSPDNLPFLGNFSFTRKSSTPKSMAQEKFPSFDKKSESGRDISPKYPMRSTTTNFSQIANFFG